MTEYKLLIENNETKETKIISIFGDNLATYHLASMVVEQYQGWSLIGSGN